MVSVHTFGMAKGDEGVGHVGIDTILSGCREGESPLIHRLIPIGSSAYDARTHGCGVTDG